MTEKEKILKKEIKEVGLDDFDLTKLQRLFTEHLLNPEITTWSDIADYAKDTHTPKNIIIKSMEDGKKLSYIISLAQVIEEWTPEEQEELLEILKEFKKKEPEKLPDQEGQEKELTATRPENLMQPLVKVGTQLFNHRENLEDKLQGLKAKVSKDKAADKFVYINLEENENIKGLENLTEFDKSVHNAVISLFNATGERIFTARQVTQFLFYGTDTINRASASGVAKVDASIKKLMSIQVTIDFKDHAELNKLRNITKFELSRYILPLDKIKIKSNGELIEAYSLIVKPPVYEYAQLVNQISQTPTLLLNVPTVKDSSETTIIIRDYLLEEIAHIKNNSTWGNTKTIDYILEYAGIDLTKYKTASARSKKRKSIIDTIEKFLIYWQQQNYITGYEINKKNNRIYSFTIKV